MKKNSYNCGKNNSHYRHGMRGTRFYNIWRSMKTRCYNKNRMYYKNYGGRGIIICEKWKNSFENFFEDMYLSYIDHCNKYGETDTSIERKNNDGNYCFKNCKWATRLEQGNNSRNVKKIIFNNKIDSMSNWAKKYNIPLSTFCKKLKRGIPIKDIIN